jgi:hypothetical protein
MTESEQGLDLEALLDPARLAAAWQVAHARQAVSEAEIEAEIEHEAEIQPLEAGARPEDDGGAVVAEELAVEATRASEQAPPPLPVSRAHQHFRDELEHTLAAVPALADKARRVLGVPLAQLAQALEPLDLAAAEAALDQLEDVWHALLLDAGWPRIPERGED